MGYSIKQLVLNPSLDSWFGAIVGCLGSLTRIARSAKRLNIGDVGTPPGNNRDNVIGRQFLFLAAASTTATILLTQCLPLCRRIGAARPSQTGAAAVMMDGSLFGVILSPSLKTLPACVWVILSPPLFAVALPSRIFIVPSAPLFSVLIGIIPLPFFNSGTITLPTPAVIVPIASPALLTGLAVFFCHNEKTPLPVARKELNDTIHSGRLLRPHVLGLLIAVARTFLFIPQLYHKKGIEHAL